MGREIAPRLAARIDASVCLDYVKIEVDPESGTLLQTKPVYGGNALAVWTSSGQHPQIVTLRPRSTEAAKPDSSRRGEILSVEAEIDDFRFRGKLLETVKEEVKGIKLDEAKVIVAGGGGIGGEEGFHWLGELAGLLQGAVGISRVPCDEGWMPKSLEIGQTGLVVSPDLYIAVGRSAAHGRMFPFQNDRSHQQGRGSPPLPRSGFRDYRRLQSCAPYFYRKTQNIARELA